MSHKFRSRKIYLAKLFLKLKLETTAADGTYELKTNFTGEGTLEFSLAGFVTQTFPADVPEGGELIQDAVLVLA